MKKLFGFILKTVFGMLANWVGGYLQRRKLASETARADTAEATVKVHQQELQNEKVRNHVEEATATLKPVGGITRIDADPPGTAGAELRNDGLTY
jgi:hypothetical protein